MRAYYDVFLKHGVALIGPGDAGPWKPNRPDEEFGGGYVRRFASEVQKEDVILLRTGQSEICALGLVASEYTYMNQFDDVNGCDLQHGRRVRWRQLPENYTFQGTVFGGNPSRFSRVHTEEIIRYADRFLNSPPTRWQTSSLPALPDEEPVLEEPPENLRGLIAEIHDLLPLFWDREAYHDHPSEDELIVHFVAPFLRCLGWPPEFIGVKWRHVDVAVFNCHPRSPENCRFIIEAKRLGEGVEGAFSQAMNYLRALGIQRDVVVTDGVRYRFYSCEEDFESIAYANLGRLKKSALELFERLKRP